MSADPISSNLEIESDDDLRRVYGDEAIFTRAGLFLLVHLDAPTAELVAKRTAEFSPDDYFEDDCPLCQASRSQGGHIVFAGSDDDACVDGDDSADEITSPGFYAATPIKAPAVELLRALDRLDIAADELVCSLEPISSAELLKRTIEDVGFMHDRFVESMWAEESPTLPEVFEQQYAKAIATLSAVREAHESLSTHVAAVTESLDAIRAVSKKSSPDLA